MPLSITALVRLMCVPGAVGSGVPPRACHDRITAATATASTTATHRYRLSELCLGRLEEGRWIVVSGNAGHLTRS